MTVEAEGASRKGTKIPTTSTTTRLTKADYARVWAEAKAAGEAAAVAVTPEPIFVYEAHLDGSPVKGGGKWISQYGLCGFAFITIRPATSGFARWLKAQGVGHKGYYGGLEIFVHPEHGRGTPLTQSVEVKGAYARAAAEVLRGYGIAASATERLD